MKIKINKKLLLGFSLIFLFFTFIVYAASSTDFYAKARKYIDSNCSKGFLSNETSLNCYLFYKAVELETKINSNTSRISTLESVPTPTPLPAPLPQKELKTFDNSGNELGLYIDRSSFFYTPLDVIIPLNDDQIRITTDDVWYHSEDCTGTAYYILPYPVFSFRDYWNKVSEIYKVGSEKYYTVDRGPGLNADIHSMQRYSNGAFSCLSSSILGIAWSLTPVTLPFSEPIELPLQFKYQ